MKTLIVELRRRNLFRVAGVYAVVGWLLIQVVVAIEAPLSLPDWFDTLFIVLLLIGFPIALLLAWAFEMTPDGMKRTETVAKDKSLSAKTGQRLDYVILGALVLVGALVIWQGMRPPLSSPILRQAQSLSRTGSGNEVNSVTSLNPYPEGSSEAIATKDANANTTPVIPALDRSKSIAVLPFADFSQGKDQEWFADGLTEEILNALARTPDLLVSSRTSSFKFKNTNKEIPAIAKALGVAHVLEGSVRRGGKRLRVTAQLIRASDGFHLWSQTYDSTSDDVIAIQEDMAIKIATALKTAMDPEALASMVRAGTRSIPAYEAYLQGLALKGQGQNVVSVRKAYKAFENARALDPGFSDALFQASRYWAGNLIPSTTYAQNVDEVGKNYREYLVRIDAAIAASAGRPKQLRYRADKALIQFRLNDAVRYLEQYLQGAPLDFGAWNGLARSNFSLGRYDAARSAIAAAQNIASGAINQQIPLMLLNYGVGDYQAAANVARHALVLHPDNMALMYQVHRAFLWVGEIDKARALMARITESQIDEPQKLIVQLRQACADEDRTKAENVADRIFAFGNDEASTKWLARQLLGDTQGAAKEISRLDRSNPPILLSGWLFYAYFDAQEFPKLSEILKRENITRPPVTKIPFACPAAKKPSQ